MQDQGPFFVDNTAFKLDCFGMAPVIRTIRLCPNVRLWLQLQLVSATPTL
jgi:hypothetical protein